MRFSQISLGALALTLAAPALADPLPAAPAFVPLAADPAPAPAQPLAAVDDAPAAPAPAFTVTGNVTLITDYRFRGLTQSKGDVALQGGLNLNHSSGFYVGVWSSTIDGGLAGTTPALTGYGGAEVDLFGGFTKTLKSGVGFDLGLLYYYYPDHSKGFNTDFFEPYASINYTMGPVNAKLGAAYAWGGQDGLNFTSGKDDNIYVYGELATGIPKTPLTLKGHLGYTSGSLGLVNLSSADDNYLDWSITAEAAIKHIKVGVSYVDTDISNAKGVYTIAGRTRTDKFASFYGRGATVLGYVGFTF